MVESRQRELFNLWIKAAEHDLQWAKGSFKLEEYAGVCFLSQQIVEKTLKAFLYLESEELRKIHDLDNLLSQAIKYDKNFEKFIIATSTLSNYYLRTRYPDIGDVNLFDKKELAEEALTWAEDIFKFVKSF